MSGGERTRRAPQPVGGADRLHGAADRVRGLLRARRAPLDATVVRAALDQLRARCRRRRAPTTVDVRARGRARAVGAVREADRLGSVVVGTEHLLMAAFDDPVVRFAFHTVAADVGRVADEVCWAMSVSRARGQRDGITAVAADAIMQVTGDDARLDVDAPAVADIARVRQALAVLFLTRTEVDEARSVLLRLGVIEHCGRVLAVLQAPADRSGRSGRPPPRAGRTAMPALRCPSARRARGPRRGT